MTIAAAALLTGCTANPGEPTSTPTESATTTPAPSATPVALPTVEEALAALDSAAEDDRTPDIRMGVLLEPGQSQYVEDGREIPFGPGVVRIACTSADGGDVAVTLTIGAEDPVTFTAACGTGRDDGTSIVTSQEQAFDFTAPYRFTLETPVASVVAVGVVKSAAQ